MSATLRAVLLAAVAPPLILVAYVYVSGARSLILDYLVILAGIILGVVGIALANWSRRTTVIAIVGYMVFASVSLPLALFLMVCSTGDCI